MTFVAAIGMGVEMLRSAQHDTSAVVILNEVKDLHVMHGELHERA